MPLRLKIVLILAATLVASLGGLYYAGSTLIVEDKASYIMDYNSALVRAAAASVESQLRQARLQLRLAHSQWDAANPGAIRPLYDEAHQKLGMRGLLLLSISPEGAMRKAAAFGDEAERLPLLLDQLAWTSHRFRGDRSLTARTPRGELAIGVFAPEARGAGMAYLAVLRPRLELPEASQDFGRDFGLLLVDSTATVVFSKLTPELRLPHAQLAKQLRPILDASFDSGVREWRTDRGTLVAAYHRIGPELMAVGLVHSRLAYAALNGLRARTLVLGASIMLLAIALTLLFVKRVTEGLRQMDQVTRKVSRGDFSFRVDTSALARDEIGSLAHSFNAMADKIDELMLAVETKVEARRDQETVTLIQSNLVPEKPYSHSNVLIGGRTLTARQCGGDWWSYAAMGDHVALVVGKVDGKGLPAAMLTAAASGVLSTFAGTTRLASRKLANAKMANAPLFNLLITQMNLAIIEASRGQGRMSCVMAMIDSQTGQVQLFNAGHAPPLLHRIGFGGRPDDDAERYSTIGAAAGPLLGESEDLEPKVEIFQLKAEDLLVFRTRGMPLEGSALYSAFAKAVDDFGVQPERVSKAVIEQGTKNLSAEALSDLPDDMSLVVLGAAKKAYFLTREEAA